MSPLLPPRGFSILVGVGQTDCLDSRGQTYDAQVLVGMPAVAAKMEAIARQAGYRSRLRLVSRPDRSVDPANLATKANFLTALTNYCAEMQAGDHLLITFAGHGERRWPGGESGWVFQDDHLYADELGDHLNGAPAGGRTLLISESCYSGGLIGAAPDSSNHLVADHYQSTTIQISASYRYELARVVDGDPVFTASLLDVWADGHFVGDHSGFTTDIQDRMRERFGAAEDGRIYQELRYLASGRNRDEILAFEQLTPFWVGGHRPIPE